LLNNFLNDKQLLLAGKGVVNYAFPVLLKRAAVEPVIGMVNHRKQHTPLELNVLQTQERGNIRQVVLRNRNAGIYNVNPALH